MNTDGTSSTEITETDGDVRVFRVRRYYRNLGIFFLIIFVLAGICSAFAVWINPPPNNKFLLISFLSLVWSFMSGLSLWILLAYKYGFLTVQNETIIGQGVIFRKEIDLSSVKQAHWKLVQGGGITLKSLTEKISIYFDNFEREERLWLIHHFQSTLPEPVQHNWDLFCHKIAIPLRDYKPEEFQPPGADEVLLTRNRWDWYFIPFIFLTIVLGIIAAWKFQLPRLLSAPVLPTILWLMLRYRTPKRGIVSQRISADKELTQMLIFLSCWGVLGLIGIIIIKIIDFPEPQNTISNVCLMCIWFIILLIIGSKLNRANHQRNLKNVKESMEKWNAESFHL